MAIIQSPTAPEDGPSAVFRALSDLETSGDRRATLGSGAETHLSQPLPVYRLGLSDIREGMDVENCAAHAGWRYLLERSGGGQAAFADVRQAGGESEFVSLSRNSNAVALLEAAHLAGKIGEESPEQTEVRVLDISALKLAALWLKAKVQVFIVYIDGSRLFGSQTPVVSEEAFLRIIAREADVLRSALPARDTGRASA